MLKWLKFNPKFFLYTFLTLTCLFTVSALAQANLLKDKQNAISQGGNQEAWLSEAFSSNAVAGLQALVGPIPDDVIDGNKPTTWIPGGAIGSVSQAIAYTFTPPASGIDYIAKTWDGFLGKPAYAQNTGFVGLQPILPIWRGFRNVVYILSSLIFIVIGIMIMLRVKISPQAVITVQNAIPQLITTLILVTFSYAIAGLLIDLMNFIQGVILAALFTANSKALTDNLLTPVLFTGTDYNSLNNLNLLTTFLIITKNIGLWVVSLLGGIIGGVVGGISGTAAIPVPVVGTVVGALGGGALGAIIFTLIVSIILFINIIKYFFGLIKVYINIIFKIVLAPLEIGLGAFPGSKGGFTNWVIDLIGNLAVFPVSVFFIVLVNYIAELSSGALWAPGVINDGRFISFFIAFGGFLMLPKIPELVPQALFALKPSPWQQAAAQAYDPKNVPFYNEGARYAGGIAGQGIDQIGTKIIKGSTKPGLGVFKWAGSRIQDFGKEVVAQNKKRP